MNLKLAFAVPRGREFIGVLTIAWLGLISLFSNSTEGLDAEMPNAYVEASQTSKVWSQASATREKICINGLWQFYPIYEDTPGQIPATGSGWGWFKVPGIWPPSNRAQDILLSGEMTQHLKDKGLVVEGLRSAWYKRDISIPPHWAKRHIELQLLDVESSAIVYVQNHKIGEIGWPGGTLDLTASVEPGKNVELVIFVSPRLPPENGFIPPKFLEASDQVKNRGLCGDAFLVSFPEKKLIEDVQILTSVRNNRIDLQTHLASVPTVPFKLRAEVTKDGKPVKTMLSGLMQPKDAASGSVGFGDKWVDALLWDIDTPTLYEATVSILDGDGKVLDQTLLEHFGFREFWINGKNFYLNGHPLHVRSLYVRSNEGPADMASYHTSQVVCKRLKEYGFNSLITHNYDYHPGQIGYPDALYEATDQTGILVSFSLPNASDYKWNLTDSSVRERYRRLTQWLIRRYQNRPSIIFYAVNHNGLAPVCSNAPHRIDGVYVPNDSMLSKELKDRRKVATEIIEPFIKSLDSTRGIYHHSAGEFGEIITINHYPNWAPPQERSNWFWQWNDHGVKPLYVVEYGLPHIASFSSYRGPDFIYNVKARQQVWDSEYAAAFLNQDAYLMTAPKIQSLRDELSYAEGDEGAHWDTLNQALSRSTSTFQATQAYFARQNLPAFRGYGLSGFLPWDQQWFWLPDKKNKRVEWPERWANLSRPGIVPDWKDVGWEFIYEDTEDAFRETPIAKVFRRYNTPLLGLIVGDSGDFTEQGHNFFPGDSVSKQLLMINDTSRTIECAYRWEVDSNNQSGKGSVKLEPGTQKRVPFTFTIPKGQSSGQVFVKGDFQFGPETLQHDELAIDIVPLLKEEAPAKCRIILFDPLGETDRLLKRLKVQFERVTSLEALDNAGKLPEDTGLVIVGKGALAAVVKTATSENTISLPVGEFPAIRAMSHGMNFLFFEQTPQALQKVFGFRIAEVSHREVFMRVEDHPIWTNLTSNNLKNWRGIADVTSPPFSTEQVEPRIDWCGFENSRAWRVQTSGAVASTLIEKPQVGDFLPLADAGFDLQYSPLLEWKWDNGRALFFQFNVSSRSLNDAAGDTLCLNAIRYLSKHFTKAATPEVLYLGDEKGRHLLRSLKISFQEYEAGTLGAGKIIVIGPDASPDPSIFTAVQEGATLVGIGLTARELELLAPQHFQISTRRTIPVPIEIWSVPVLRGISNAELHWHSIPMLDNLSMKDNLGSDVLGIFKIGKGQIILIQGAPWIFSDPNKQHLRTTYRRSLYLVSRIFANLGVSVESALPSLLSSGYQAETQAWLKSYYKDIPVPEDDPYRYYGW